MDGSATLTMVTSSTIMSAPMQSRPMASQRRSWSGCGAWAAVMETPCLYLTGWFYTPAVAGRSSRVGELETDYAGEYQGQAQEPERGAGFTQEPHAEHRGAEGADAGPHRVG